jgi:hypothetical protein
MAMLACAVKFFVSLGESAAAFCAWLERRGRDASVGISTVREP